MTKDDVSTDGLVERLNSFIQCGCCDEEWPQLRQDTVHRIDALQRSNAEMREALEKLLAEARERGGALSDGEVLGCAAIRNSKALPHSSETKDESKEPQD